jgi:23S rRNA U2552 (ribose-2'-O)-methylase RlmE/FtsJ
MTKHKDLLINVQFICRVLIHIVSEIHDALKSDALKNYVKVRFDHLFYFLQDHFKRYTSLSPRSVFNRSRREVIVCFVDSGEIIDHHRLNFFLNVIYYRNTLYNIKDHL